MTVQELFKSLGFKAISDALLHTHNRHELTVHDSQVTRWHMTGYATWSLTEKEGR